MKIRSKALYQFLVDTGAIDGTKEEVEAAKKEFRRRYQRENKRKRKALQPDIRISLTHRELFEIKVKAIECGMSYTDYIKQTVLSTLTNTLVIPNRSTLEQILQSLGI